MIPAFVSPHTLPDGKVRKEGGVGGQGVGAHGGSPSASVSIFPADPQTLFFSVLASSINLSIFPQIKEIKAPE